MTQRGGNILQKYIGKCFLYYLYLHPIYLSKKMYSRADYLYGATAKCLDSLLGVFRL